jgi:site-specific DNA-methyltransferase (adenine-specific)
MQGFNPAGPLPNRRVGAPHRRGRFFDLIFADPPYFLSNDGITCHAGKMVSVNKGKWDQSKGAEADQGFNLRGI